MQEGLGMTAGFLDDRRAVLRIEGADARDWLQGLVTNDMRRLAPGAALYAALLTPQGKYLFDFIVVEGSDGAIWLDVAADRAAALAQRLAMYRLRRAVTIAPTALRVALASGPRPETGALVVADPRDARLGWRLYGSDPAAGLTPAARAEYDALRVRLAVPDSGVELVPDDSYILEAGFDRLNGVDFRKGCYVGQEVTARMRHKTELRKGLVRVRVQGEAPPGTPVRTLDGRPAGTLFTVAGGHGLAHLRFDRMDGPLTAGSATVTADDQPAAADPAPASAASTAASPSR
ncbi:MAG: YgfZ/GcvT domain-containing protein [Rubrimonas sp.]